MAREQPPEDVSVRSGTEVADACEEVERLGAVRSREATVFELLKQLLALFEFLRILHASRG
ncbi:hypothetical protein AU252_01695 [Pseudarthrobacter sulfonivorans]|uniref:Uncharacterized protein n=1 Tax=Pseudarthrobacter sulfonivorans TaxID=121292 RepID=A0A0U3QK91_9MICC|nr:hypothetical protein AU252_01695 [Pseudarthrobacter sulfonivorans]